MPDAPLTADGEQIVPGMDLYRLARGGTLLLNVVACTHGRLVLFKGGNTGYRPEFCYAHRENAEAARQGENAEAARRGK